MLILFDPFLQNKLQQDVRSTKGDLNDINNNISGTKDKLSDLKTGTQDSINKVSTTINNTAFIMDYARPLSALGQIRTHAILEPIA